MSSSFFAMMAAAIRLVGLLPGALVVVAGAAIIFAASTAVTIVAVGLGTAGTIIAAVRVLDGGLWVATGTPNSTATLVFAAAVTAAVRRGSLLLSLALFLLELGELSVPHVVGVVLGEGRTERSRVLLDLVVCLGVLLLVGPGESQEHSLCELVRRRARELRAEDPTVEVGEHGCSTAEARIWRHCHGLLGVTKPSDDPVTDELDAADLFEEKREAVQKVRVREIIRTFGR
jgi:hypothetical protein